MRSLRSLSVLAVALMLSGSVVGCEGELDTTVDTDPEPEPNPNPNPQPQAGMAMVRIVHGSSDAGVVVSKRERIVVAAKPS